MHSTISAAALAALVPLAAAHGFVNNINANGVDSKLNGPQWLYNDALADAGWRAGNGDNGFVASDASTLSGGQIACHKGRDDGPAAQANKGAAVAVTAGSPVTLTWSTWPESHHGPVMNYMAKCPGTCSELADATGLEFFKVQESGLISGATDGGRWATDELIDNGLKSTFTVPSDLADGEYVIRHEILALHSAGSEGGAQFYPQCISVAVSGGGSSNPSGTAASALYKSSDPGVTISIYQRLASYTIPGPAPIAGAANRTVRAAKQFIKKWVA